MQRRSTTSTIHTYNGTIFDWICSKQNMTADCTNGSKIRALHLCVRRIIVHRRFLMSAGHPIQGPTIAYEDNSATITQVLKDRLTPQVKHMDLKVTWMHQQKLIGIFTPHPCPTDRQQADFNSKPTGGCQLQNSVLHLVGARFYPPKDSEHFCSLELDKYDIGIHRGSFRLIDPSMATQN